jgi:zinc transport system substrate-binding protein
MKRLANVTGLAFCLLIAGHPALAAKVKIFVSIAPQQYFVQKIGGDLVDVSVLVAPGADPHTYEPKPRQMTELAKTAVYFAVGIDFEKAWMKKIAAANPQMRIVQTDEGVAKIAIAGHQHHEHEKGPKEAHAINRQRHAHAGEPDPHVWLSPPLVRVQAGNIKDALVAVDSANRSRYEENYTVFLREIEALDAEFKSLFAGRQGTRFMVFHPSWGYFAQAYGLEQVPIEIEGKDPKPAQLQELIHHAKEHDIQVVFVQPQFSLKSAEMVSREIGGQVAYADPLAANWAENLREVARKFKAALR